MIIKIYYTNAATIPHPMKLKENEGYIHCEDTYYFPDVKVSELKQSQKDTWIANIMKMHYDDWSIWVNKVEFIDNETNVMNNVKLNPAWEDDNWRKEVLHEKEN